MNMNEQFYQDLIKQVTVATAGLKSKYLLTAEDDYDFRPCNADVVNYITNDLNIDWDDTEHIEVPFSYFIKIWGPDYTQNEYKEIIDSEEYKKLKNCFEDLWEAVYDVFLSDNIEAARDYQDEIETQRFLNRWIVRG